MNLFKRSLLGVDVGSRTIKGVRLTKKKGRVALEDYFFFDLAKTENGNPSEANSVECLKAGIEVNNLKNSRTAASLPDHEVIRVAFDMPKMKPTELRTAVRHELSEHTGIPENELAFDFIENKTPLSSQGSVGITAFGTHRKSVEQLVKTLNTAQLQTAVIESDTLAITSMLEFNGYIQEKGVFVIFDMGESHLTATLICDGELKLSKSTKVGWGNVNSALSERFGFSYIEAEDCKCKYDFNSSSQKEEKTEHAIDDVYASIISEIKASLEIFKEYSPETNMIDNVILVGGGSQTKNLCRVLEIYFKIPTTIANPFRNIDIFSKKNGPNSEEIANLAPYMSAAVGLALIGLTPKEAKAA
jgi:type IV pilus assembly protein PilM